MESYRTAPTVRERTTSSADSEFIALQEALAGRYSLERELGRGGMGIVYLAHEVALDRPVALKLLPPAMASEPTLRERFLREARTAARLSQPNIVPIHTVDQVGPFAFFTMAYVDGESLGAAVRQRGPLGATDASRILREVAWALAHAHAHGVVHRDVKPDNILLEEGSGRALVTDFGIAQVSADLAMTGRGAILGTPEFMSPEQASGEPVDARSDIYSLGVVGFYILSGRLPFDGESVAALLAKHITQPAPSITQAAPDVPRYLAHAVDRCLAKSPAERFANGQDLAVALTQAPATRREIPLPLRVFIKENREQFRGLPAWAALFTSYAVFSVFMGVTGDTPAALVGAFLVTTIGSAPLVMLLRMARRLAKAGYGHGDLMRALKEDLRARREELAFELRGERNWIDRTVLGLWYGGVAATGLGTGLALLLDLNAIPGVALGALAGLTFGGALATLVGLPLAAARGGRRPGLAGRGWARFWRSRVGAWLFKAAGIGIGAVAAPATGYRHTEMAIGMAADRLFDELPKPLRRQLRDLPAVVRRLEQDAQAMRQRIEELDGVGPGRELIGDRTSGERSGAGSSGSEVATRRDELAQALARARAAAQSRLQEAVTALETIRLDLLRMRAGTGGVAGITQNLARAGEIAADIERLLEGREAVEQFLRDPERSSPAS